MAVHAHPVIVAGFEETAAGRDAVAVGRRLAEATGSLLVVARVYPHEPGLVPEPAMESSADEKLRRDAFAELAGAEAAVAGFERWEPYAVGAPSAARGLLELARERAAQMIVVGATHRHGLGRAAPGATTDKVLHGAPCTVAVAPAGWSEAGDHALRRIAVGYDESEESRGALQAAAQLARATGAELDVVMAFERPNPNNIWFAMTGKGYGEFVREMRADAETILKGARRRVGEDVQVTTQLIDGHPVDVLAGTSASSDLLVVGSRGYGPVRATMPGSVTSALLPRACCPVLVVPRGVEDPLAGMSELVKGEAT